MREPGLCAGLGRGRVISGQLISGRLQSVRFGIALLFLASGAGYGAWAASVAGVKLSLGLSDGALGLALLCLAAGAMVAMPVAGWLGTRGHRWLLTGTGLFFVVILPLPGVAGGGLALGASLLLMGAASGSLDVCMNARASRFEQEAARPTMSSLHAAFSLGGLLGTLLVAGCEAAGLGVLGGLVVAAGAMAVAVAAHAVLDPKPALAEPGVRAGWQWPGAALWGIGALCALAFMTEGAVADWSGVFLRQVAGFGAPAGAAGYAAFSAGMVAARLAGDGWVKRFGRTRVLGWGAALAAAGMAMAMAMPVSGSIGFALVGLGGANVAPILFSAAGRAGAAASTGIATVATLGYGGMLLGPPVIGAVADAAGLRAALGALVAAMLVVAGAAWSARGPVAHGE